MKIIQALKKAWIANQFQNLFRNNDRVLKKATFRLWETYEKEMSKQFGSQRLNGPDINNTINESLNSFLSSFAYSFPKTNFVNV